MNVICKGIATNNWAQVDQFTRNNLRRWHFLALEFDHIPNDCGVDKDHFNLELLFSLVSDPNQFEILNTRCHQSHVL
jgi:hypothetical protein